MDEYCIVSDEGVLEADFYSVSEAEAKINESYPEDDCTVERRDLYDEDGYWIEESDEDGN